MVFPVDNSLVQNTATENNPPDTTPAAAVAEKIGENAPFEHGQRECLGILLINLGTPAAPTTKAVRQYLGEFLWDPRVVEIPRPLWWLILHGAILPFRPAQSARKYQTIWSEQGSPLLAITQRQAAAIAAQLQERCPGPVEVAVAMRYGQPAIAAALRKLHQAGARRLLVVPLYPQYSATTTASTFDAVTQELRTWRWLPELRFINHYHDDPGYIAAVADSISAAWQQDRPARRLLFSFHGLPKRNLLAGDPYHCECQKTARLIAERLNLKADDWAVAFQSRFGRAEWLKPYTSELLREWGQAKIESVDVVCPGFAADCLETLEEIEQENRQYFLEAGGVEYRYIPALNDRPRHIAVLTDLILRHAAGWPETAATYDPAAAAEARQTSRARARALGAER